MNKSIMRLSMSTLALTTMVLFLVGTTQAQGQNLTPSVQRMISFNRTLSTPCKERRIRLTGAFQVQYKVAREAGAQTHIEGDINADRISGFGLTSRGRYKAVGTGRLESTGPSPTTFTYVFNFALNKSGTTDGLMGHVKFRISVDANNKVNTTIVDANVDCAN